MLRNQVIAKGISRLRPQNAPIVVANRCVEIKGNGCDGCRLTVTTHVLLEIADLRERRVLSAGAQEVAEALQGDTAVAALVEQRERLLVVGRSLITLVISGHVEIVALKSELLNCASDGI